MKKPLKPTKPEFMHIEKIKGKYHIHAYKHNELNEQFILDDLTSQKLDYAINFELVKRTK